MQLVKNKDYKAVFHFDRLSIDSKIENFEQLTDLAINVFSGVWGNIFRNEKLKQVMKARCNQCFTRLYFEDVVRLAFLIKYEKAGYTPIFKSYFLFLLDYSNSENIFFSGNCKFFNFAILNKIWFKDKWLNYLKNQMEYSLLISNCHIDILPKNKEVKVNIKTKPTKASLKNVDFKFENKFFGDNYLIVSTLLRRLHINMSALSKIVGFPVVALNSFIAGKREPLLLKRLKELYVTNKLTKCFTILDLCGMSTSGLRCVVGSKLDIDRLTNIVIKAFCLELCDAINSMASFSFHEKRLNKKANRNIFERLTLYFVWLLDGFENDVSRVAANYFSSVFGTWKGSALKFKSVFLAFDSFCFNWEVSIFLSRSAGSFFVDKNFSQTFVAGDSVLINPQFGKITLQGVKKRDIVNGAYYNNCIKIEKKIRKNKKYLPKKYGLFTERELASFRSMSRDALENELDKQSQVFTDNPELDQKRFNQILDIQNSSNQG